MALPIQSHYKKNAVQLPMPVEEPSDTLNKVKISLTQLQEINGSNPNMKTSQTLNQEFSPAHSDVRSKESTCVSELSISSPTFNEEAQEDNILESENLDSVIYSFDEGKDTNSQSSSQTLSATPSQDLSVKNPINQTELNPVNSIFDNGNTNKSTDVQLETKPSMQSTKSNYIPKITSKSIASKLTPEDEQILLRLVVQLKNSWKKIAKRFNNLRNKNVTVHALRTRYAELAPKLFKKKGKFTHQEDLLLAKYYADYGSDWQKIAAHVKNRTPNMLKNRYYSYIRKKKILNLLLDELHMKDQNQALGLEEQPKLESPNSTTNKSNEHDFEVIHLFKENDEKVTCRTVELPVIDTSFLDCISPEDELHVRITPLSIPTNITEPAFQMNINNHFSENYSYMPSYKVETRMAEESTLKEPIDYFFPFKDEKEEATETSKIHSYHLRERRSNYVFKRNEYW